jgi:hypothetical protein
MGASTPRLYRLQRLLAPGLQTSVDSLQRRLMLLTALSVVGVLGPSIGSAPIAGVPASTAALEARERLLDAELASYVRHARAAANPLIVAELRLELTLLRKARQRARALAP